VIARQVNLPLPVQVELDKLKYTIIESILKVLDKLHAGGLSPISHKFLIKNPKLNFGFAGPASKLSNLANKRVAGAIKEHFSFFDN
jgi:hypothetical protein